MDVLQQFYERLKKIGIDITLGSNYPWVYLETINGKKVKEKYASEYGFTVAFLPVQLGKPTVFTDIGKIFELIRKYK